MLMNDISRSKLVRYFCGTSDTNDTSKTANSSDASKTSASVIRLSSYFFPLAERLPTCATLVFFKFKQALEE